MRATGASNTQIQNALDAKRSGIRKPSERRYRPGVAKISGKLNDVHGKWLSVENDFNGPIPGQIAKRLEGVRFNSFRAFRRRLWREVAATPELAKQFSTENQRRMARGRAPFARKSRRVGRLRSYVLHHDPQISNWGDVFDMSTITVMTPKSHVQTHSKKSIEAYTESSADDEVLAVTRDEALATLNLLLSGKVSEERDWELLDALEEAFPHADITDLIYWPEKEGLMPDQVVDEAIRIEAEWAAKNR